MGDHRMSIQITAEFHGKKKSTDMWINYFPSGERIDERIIEFFEELEREGMEVSNKKMYKYHKKQEEDREKQELARLKAKYE